MELTKITAAWDEAQRKTLDQIDLNVKAGTLCAIIGPVGAGKVIKLHYVLHKLY